MFQQPSDHNMDFEQESSTTLHRTFPIPKGFFTLIDHDQMPVVLNHMHVFYPYAPFVPQDIMVSYPLSHIQDESFEYVHSIELNFFKHSFTTPRREYFLSKNSCFREKQLKFLKNGKEKWVDLMSWDREDALKRNDQEGSWIVSVYQETIHHGSVKLFSLKFFRNQKYECYKVEWLEPRDIHSISKTILYKIFQCKDPLQISQYLINEKL